LKSAKKRGEKRKHQLGGELIVTFGNFLGEKTLVQQGRPVSIRSLLTVRRQNTHIG